MVVRVEAWVIYLRAAQLAPPHARPLRVAVVEAGQYLEQLRARQSRRDRREGGVLWLIHSRVRQVHHVEEQGEPAR